MMNNLVNNHGMFNHCHSILEHELYFGAVGRVPYMVVPIFSSQRVRGGVDVCIRSQWSMRRACCISSARSTPGYPTPPSHAARIDRPVGKHHLGLDRLFALVHCSCSTVGTEHMCMKISYHTLQSAITVARTQAWPQILSPLLVLGCWCDDDERGGQTVLCTTHICLIL